MVKHSTISALRRLGAAMFQRRNQPPSRQAGNTTTQAAQTATGFTLMEPLMALVVVAVLLATTAPVIILSVASRVRARQIELATQAARSYVDNLRSGSIDPPGTLNPNITPVRNTLGRDDRYTTCTAAQTPPTRTPTDPACVRFPVPLPANFMPPTLTAADLTNAANTDQGVLIDGNGDGSYAGILDFRIQAIRTMIPGETAATPAQADAVQQRGYSIILRVYQGNSPVNLVLGTTQIERAFSAQSTSNAQGRRSNPLIVMKTEITGNSTNSDYNDPNGGSIAPGLYR